MKIEERCKVAEREHSAFDIDLDAWKAKKPFGISGCFRLRDESEWMIRAVESHLPYLEEAVLVVQPSRDNTEFLAEMLRVKHPDRVKVFQYPFDVHGIGTPGHFDSPENGVRTMMHLTNWALSRCRFSWIAKIEGDVLAMESFSRIRVAIENDPDVIRYYGRVGINVAGPKGDMFSVNAPRNAGWDEGVHNNDPFWHCIRKDKWETMNLHDHRDKLFNHGWSFVHTKRIKAEHQRLHSEGVEEWAPLDEITFDRALDAYQERYPYPGADRGILARDIIGMTRKALGNL